MLTTLLFASATASNPAELEAWLPELERAVERGDEAWLREVFAELLARAPGLSVRQLRNHLRREMVGVPSVDCRGPLCRVRFARPDDSSQLVLHRVDGAWRLWDPEFGGHVAGPVTAEVGVQKAGEVEVRINGTPTFLFDPVRDAGTAHIDRHLSPGINVLTLVPRGLLDVSLRVEQGERDLVDFDGVLEAARTFTFTVDEGPTPLPR